jgi:hypothetical protein
LERRRAAPCLGLSANARRIAAFERERTLAERVIRDKSGGVAFVEGAYTFADAEGKPLRKLLDEKGRLRNGADGQSLFTTAGSGPVFRKSYLGTALRTTPPRRSGEAADLSSTSGGR